MPKITTLEAIENSNKKYKTCEWLIKTYLEGTQIENLAQQLLGNKPTWRHHSYKTTLYYNYMILTKNKPNINHFMPQEKLRLSNELANLQKADCLENVIRHKATPYELLYFFKNNLEFKNYMNEQVSLRLGTPFVISEVFVEKVVASHIKNLFFLDTTKYITKKDKNENFNFVFDLYMQEHQDTQHPKISFIEPYEIENCIRLCYDSMLSRNQWLTNKLSQ